MGGHRDDTTPSDSSASGSRSGNSRTLKLTLDNFNSIPKALGLVLSPDGRRLVIPVQGLSPDGSKFIHSIWEMPSDGSAAARQLTYSDAGEGSPAFLPDGSLAFLSTRRNPAARENTLGSTIWLLPALGGEARPLLSVPGVVDGLVTARDASAIVIRATMFPRSADFAADAAMGRRRMDASANAVLFEELETRYRDYELGPRLPRLFRFDVGDRPVTPIDLTPDAAGALVATQYAVSPDGRTVVSRWRRPVAKGFREAELVAIDQAGRRVIARGAQFSSPAISPDGRWAVAEKLRPGTPQRAERFTLWLVNLRTGEGVDLTSELDLWPEVPVWAADSQSVYFVADERGRAPIFRVDINSHEIVKVAEDATYSSVCPAPDGETIFALCNSYSKIPGIARITSSRIGSRRRRSQSSATSASTTRLPDLGPTVELAGKLTEVSAKAEDGTEIRGYLVLPEGAAPNNPAPLVLWIHGGTRGWTGHNFWQWCPYLFAERGYAVLMVDPARSTGYGQAFMQRAWGYWGDRVMADLIAVVEVASAREDIDGANAAAMGHSFGGQMCNWIAGRSDRFKALVTVSGVWAFDQFHATTDKTTMWEEEFGDPYVDVEPYLQNSPRRNLASIRTPMLIIHGLKDYAVPISEAIRLWTDLKRHEVPAKFLLLPDENHSMIQKPSDIEVWYETALAFLDHHVLGRPWKAPDLLG